LLWLVRSASHLIRRRPRRAAKQDLIAIAGERKSCHNGGDHLSAQPHTIIRRSFAMRRLRAAQAAAMRLFHLIEVWCDRSRQRRRLASMSDYQLKDIGITRYDALKEWEKHFWQP
jgi:uncharacterized protein YjiS (DUF1127 family)